MAEPEYVPAISIPDSFVKPTYILDPSQLNLGITEIDEGKPGKDESLEQEYKDKLKVSPTGVSKDNKQKEDVTEVTFEKQKL